MWENCYRCKNLDTSLYISCKHKKISKEKFVENMDKLGMDIEMDLECPYYKEKNTNMEG